MWHPRPMRGSSSSSGWARTSSGLLVPRRVAIQQGLGALAAAFAAGALPGCGDDSAAGSGGGAVGTGGSGGAGSTTSGTGGHGGAGAGGGPTVFPPHEVPGTPTLVSLIAAIGPLGAPDENGVRLPEGFTSRVLARSTEVPVAGSGHAWHLAPDGGATYPTEDGGWIYVSNSEVPILGGVSALRFDASGELVDAYPILADTDVNCAGGRTPWQTWLSCEEIAKGQVWECDPWGEVEAVVRPALGVFKHEAVTVDPDRGHLYLTEDVDDGRFYRFVPDGVTSAGHPDLTSGRLEVAIVSEGGDVTWAPVPDPLYAAGTPTRQQVAESTAFDGGEGIWYHQGVVFFSTKGDNRVWAYDVEEARLSVLYDGDAIEGAVLRGVDNLTVSCCGDVIVAEDGDDMQVVAILPDGSLVPLLQVMGHDGSEITGPAFDPSGTRLYFSSQRGESGGNGSGVTFEVQGPFHAPA